MAKVLHTTLKIVGTPQKHGAQWLVTGTDPSSKKNAVWKFYTRRSDFSAGQVVNLTYHKATKDGLLHKARVTGVEGITLDLSDKSKAKQEIISILNKFRSGLGDWTTGRGTRNGKIVVAGVEVTVSQDSGGWFRVETPRGPLHYVWAREAAEWILTNQEPPQEPAPKPRGQLFLGLR